MPVLKVARNAPQLLVLCITKVICSTIYASPYIVIGAVPVLPRACGRLVSSAAMFLCENCAMLVAVKRDRLSTSVVFAC